MYKISLTTQSFSINFSHKSHSNTQPYAEIVHDQVSTQKNKYTYKIYIFEPTNVKICLV